MMKPVRMKVAKSLLTFSTPTLPKMAVRAANTADSTAQPCHDSPCMVAPSARGQGSSPRTPKSSPRRPTAP